MPRERRPRQTGRRRAVGLARRGRRQRAGVQHGAPGVVERHEDQHRPGDACPSRRAAAARRERAAGQHGEQVHVDDRHPVEGVPGGEERAEQPRAVRRGQVHQRVQDDAGDPDGTQPAEETPPGGRSPGRSATARYRAYRNTSSCRGEPEPGESERAVGRPAMRREVLEAAAGERRSRCPRPARSTRAAGSRSRRASPAGCRCARR